MIGIVVVAHFNLAREMVAATELIVGKQEQFAYVDIFPDEDVQKVKKMVVEALKRVDSGDGTLMLTDMFGGTPSNIALSFHNPGIVDVVTGVNLPMIIKIANQKEGDTLESLARIVRDQGRSSIAMASDFLGA